MSMPGAIRSGRPCSTPSCRPCVSWRSSDGRRFRLRAVPLPVAVVLPVTFGDFIVRREIGRGGMGIVYEAEQISLSRRVALKILSAAVGTRLPIVAAVSDRGAGGRLSESRAHHPRLRRRIARRRPLLRDAVDRGGQPGRDRGRPEADSAMASSRRRTPDPETWPRLWPSTCWRTVSASASPSRSRNRRGTSEPTTTSARSSAWPLRRLRPWTTPTSRESSTATSSRPTFSWTAPASSGSPTSDWPASSAATP